jgi:palmitoyltransferase
MGFALKCLAMFPWFGGLPLALLIFTAMHMAMTKYVVQIPSHDALWKTPYFSSIFQASAFWVIVTWMRILLPCKNASFSCLKILIFFVIITQLHHNYCLHI